MVKLPNKNIYRRYWTVYIGGNLEIIPTRIKRKQAKETKRTRNPRISSLKVRSLGIGDYYGFAVDGNHRFLLGDFTVTHNSELVNMLSSSLYIHPISSITANTLVSGAKLGGGKPASLLNKLSAGTDRPEEGILLFKDFTSLLSEQEVTQKLIMAQLREIYDGKYDKEFGTGHAIHWKGKVTIIAAATHKMYDMRQQYSAMGERFMMYEMITPDGKEASERGMTNQEEGIMDEARARLAEMVRVYVNEMLELPKELPKISRELKTKAIDLAEMTTRVRSDVKRDWRSINKEIVGVNPPEQPIRFASGLQNIARSLMVLNWNETGEFTLPGKYEKILFKYSLDSMPPNRRKAMQELSRYTVLETKGLGLKLNRPSSSLRRDVEDLVALEVADREPGAGSQGDRWKIRPYYKNLIQQFEGIQDTGTELTERLAEDEDKMLAEAEAIREDTEPKQDPEEPLF
jgi:hypothetical protein